MASMQVGRGACSDVKAKQMQFGTRATMNNKTPSSLMTLDRCINWFGSPSTGAFPDNIPNNANSKFLHVRDGELGSMAAVQYSSPPNESSFPCAWILAFYAPADNTSPSTPNRVYVACGTKERMDLISWDQILQNLEEGSTTSEAHDSYSKTSVDAQIYDPVPNTATLNANFGFMA
ncbi:jasmonate-induced protein homolog [Silene latifolia]|uniref:jasmonate-induced protein homolog n=1 Tax=Silene latifolia TaxID=37657 RepID=UPI003D78AE4C